ncbi:interleukin-1 receptor-associated kinase 3-like isoform X2 [Sinocyclocheilus rhinocerous]|uniref:Interleukin-1 receptor-associated kinase 3-like n=1 Tax=Sinocyclocheilus rhinocerous TaxID=307959 RepID=A0A673H6M2_9TELE|nr:PREDICTED: interleukin-1 receptor-associated kinase 3-like isoform X1 [Sinocyclocheilus rhinocerous]XP_016390519.1 PREDICTED: interleukin-1 receptor-associated kinase 3-like isoform X2 [Sinocyclocheilus rhinocerous]
MSGKIDTSTFLFDVPPVLMGSFCRLMDSAVDGLGWRALATHILPSQLEVRCVEMYVAAGKSPTQELMWLWAQQNKTVGDLLKVLDKMGHARARSLFQSQDSCMLKSSSPTLFATHLPNTEESCQISPLNPESVSVKGEKQKYFITYNDVIEGTRHFHQDLKIGASAFAEVYCGKWGNGSFAVKVFKQGNKANWKALWEKFTKEIEVLQLYQHPNILELWGSFSEADRFCLVYPYLHNGSLFHRLHEEVQRPRSWQERLNIIKGTAKAVNHLHTAQPCMVICGNITSSNILLDEHLQPKLSDFGLACLRPHSVDQSCTIVMDTASHSNLCYLPEEYIRDGKLSVKLDVYSLGMVILETCTGQKVKQESRKSLFLRDVLHSEFEEKGSVDACLRFLDPKVEHWPAAVALCLLRIGLECTGSKMRVRPSMEMVLQRLNQLLPMPALPEDQPHTLDDTVPLQQPYNGHSLRLSFPIEVDEMYSPLEEPQPHRVPNLAEPCECSQSEVTFLSVGDPNWSHSLRECLQENDRVVSASQSLQSDSAARLDLYGSWPVECSCSTGTEAQGCEDCCANGFSQSVLYVTLDDDAQPSQNGISNPAKEKIRNKIHLYNQGLIKTEELLSLKSE